MTHANIDRSVALYFAKSQPKEKTLLTQSKVVGQAKPVNPSAARTLLAPEYPPAPSEGLPTPTASPSHSLVPYRVP